MSWNMKALRVDLSNRKSDVELLDKNITEKLMGGRGIASHIVWDELEAGVDPLGPKNKLIVASGPLTGLPIPSSGKLVMAGKSPSTNAYGDGNIGTKAAPQLKKAGYDVLIFEGVATEPLHLHISDDGVEFHDAGNLWGKDTFKKEEILVGQYGEQAGRLVIGEGGENLVNYAVVVSQNGRAGGRAGMGAVMGSKKLAAITIKGDGDPEIHDKSKLMELTKEAYQDISDKDEYDFWKRQGTMQVFSYCNENSILPTRNFQEGQFEKADVIDGFAMEREKVDRKGCPNCNMQCGNVIEDSTGKEAELDYENVGMLGPNLALTDLNEIGTLNRLCDKYGLDTISTGSSIAFAMELAEKGLLDEDFGFGDFGAAKGLVKDIAKRQGLGDKLAQGTKSMAEQVGHGAEKFAMHVKGLEVSAYDCHTLPGMALGYGTSPIGGHHKDCWVISWEVDNDRFGYSDRKIEEVIDLQRKRGAVFEAFTVCRLPWVELGFSLDWYEKFFQAATGDSLKWQDFNKIADRIYTLIRSIMVRERGDNWSIDQDVPPKRWFEEPLSKGNFKGKSLDKENYLDMLKRYYKKRGWDQEGKPTEETLDELDLLFIDLSTK